MAREEAITFYCKLCGFEAPKESSIKRHITSSKDDDHNGRKGTHSHIGETHKNKPEKEIVETSNNTGSYKGPAEGIDATVQNITERPVQNAGGSGDEKAVVVAMDSETLFELIRTADKDVAWRLFEQLQEGPKNE